MADQIEISNVQGSKGVASEATLERLVKALEGMGASGPGGSTSSGSSSSGGGIGKETKKSADELKRLAKESKDANKEVKSFGDEIEDTTSLVSDFGSGLASAGKMLGGAVLGGLTSIANSALGLAGELMNGGNRMSDFSKHLPLVGGVLSGVIGYFEEGVDSFRTLSDSGAAFGNNLITLRKAAADAQMPLEMFTQTIAANSSTMMFLGGTVTAGAKRFGTLTAAIRTSSEDFLGMGYTMEGLNEHTAGYLKLQARLGRIQGKSNEELATGAGDYLKELDKLAKVTGMSRKEAEELMNQQAQEANIRAMQSKLTGQELTNFNSGMAFVEKNMPGLAGAFKDLADGVAQTDVGQKIASLSPGLAKLFGEVGKGKVGLAELQAGLKDNLPALTKLRDSMGGAAVSALMGEAGFGELFQSLYQADEFLGKTFDPEKADAEQKKRDKATQQLAGFEQVIASVRSAFTTAFIDSGVLKLIGDQIGKLSGSFAGAATGLGDMVKKIFTSPTFLTMVENLGIALKNLSENFSAIADDLLKLDFKAAFKKLFAGTKTVPKPGESGTPGSSGQSGSSNPASLELEIPEAEDTGDMFGGILEAVKSLLSITWGDIALGIGLVGGTIAAIGFAATAAAPGIAAMAAAFYSIGAAAAGIGIALGAASLVVTAFGDSVAKVIGAITKFKTAAADAQTKQIETLTNLPSENMYKAAGGITAIKNALEGFGGGFLDNLGSAFTSFLGGDKLGGQLEFFEKIAALGPSLSAAGTGIEKIFTQPKEVPNLTLDNSEILSYTSSVKELTEALKLLRAELSKQQNNRTESARAEARPAAENRNTAGSLPSIVGTPVSSIIGNNNNRSEQLDELNDLMYQVLDTLQQGTRYTRDTARTLRGSGNLMRGI